MPKPNCARADRVVKTMWPGMPGAKEFAQKYGDQLVCVRYRRPGPPGTKYQVTVELKVAGPNERSL